MKRRVTRLLSVAISGALLFFLDRSIDVRMIGDALLRADPLWLVISIGMILPITLLRAVRFLSVAPPGALPGFAEALRLTLVAALNMVVPAKGAISSRAISSPSAARPPPASRSRSSSMSACAICSG